MVDMMILRRAVRVFTLAQIGFSSRRLYAMTVATSSTTAYQAGILADFVQAQLHNVRRRPLMVSMQGPQGAGKSTLASALVGLLANKKVKCQVSSLDDFYFPYTGLQDVARRNPENIMLQGRGLPGTHDTDLLHQALTEISAASGSNMNIPLPIFDKSQYAGYGDRSPDQVIIQDTPDVFILEGWCLGFRPLPVETLRQRWQGAKHANRHSFASIETINRNLNVIVDKTYGFFNAHISLQPDSYDNIYVWRTQQEHAMKAGNGGKGMADEQVVAFVDRYMPLYELYGDTTRHAQCLTIRLGQDRSVLSVR